MREIPLNQNDKSLAVGKSLLDVINAQSSLPARISSSASLLSVRPRSKPKRHGKETEDQFHLRLLANGIIPASSSVDDIRINNRRHKKYVPGGVLTSSNELNDALLSAHNNPYQDDRTGSIVDDDNISDRNIKVNGGNKDEDHLEREQSDIDEGRKISKMLYKPHKSEFAGLGKLSFLREVGVRQKTSKTTVEAFRDMFHKRKLRWVVAFECFDIND